MENITYHLQGVIKSEEDYKDFEGPLNLILMLLSKNKIEIKDIKISLILDQYLEQIDIMQSMDLEVASEFIQMASHLLYLKTRTLLAGEESEVSELQALISSLEQLKSRDAYASIQKITPEFDSATRRGLLYQSRQPEPLPKQEYGYRHAPVELLSAIANMLARGAHPEEADEKVRGVPQKIVYGVRVKSREIIDRLKSCEKQSLRILFAECGSKSEMIATFISVLEMCAVGGLLIEQEGEDYLISLAETMDEERFMERLELQVEGA